MMEGITGRYCIARRVLTYHSESFGLEFNPNESELLRAILNNPNNVWNNFVRCERVKINSIHSGLIRGINPNESESFHSRIYSDRTGINLIDF